MRNNGEDADFTGARTRARSHHATARYIMVQTNRFGSEKMRQAEPAVLLVAAKLCQYSIDVPLPRHIAETRRQTKKEQKKIKVEKKKRGEMSLRDSERRIGLLTVDRPLQSCKSRPTTHPETTHEIRKTIFPLVLIH